MPKRQEKEVKFMKKMALSVIGLIGGILVVAGVFLPWVSASVFGVTFTASGWDALKASVSKNPDVLLGLIGGIIALIGGLVSAIAIKMKNLGYLILLGGILAVLAWIWSAYTMTDWSAVTYGFYIYLVGAIIALISGIMVVRAKE
jgi:hypothetical protein